MDLHHVEFKRLWVIWKAVKVHGDSFSKGGKFVYLFVCQSYVNKVILKCVNIYLYYKNNDRFLESLKVLMLALAGDALAWKGGQRRGDVVGKLDLQLSFLSL